MRVLVVGATGQQGGATVDALLIVRGRDLCLGAVVPIGPNALAAVELVLNVPT